MGKPDSKSIAVLGGGVTGLAAAYRLAKLGHRVRLFEQGPRPGGVIRTEITGGWLIEAGPNSFQENSPEITAFLDELGLSRDRVEAGPAAKNRYLVRHGRLQPLPMSPPAFLTSRLFSLSGKLRVLAEIFRRPRLRPGDISFAAFMREHFGRELVDYAIQPFVSGIYAGDPEQLSTRHAFPKLWDLEETHGSLLRGQLARARRSPGPRGSPKVISFRRGLQMLPDALAAGLPAGSIALNARVESVTRGACWAVTWQDGQVSRTEEFAAVVAALPAAALARLVIGTDGIRPLAALDAVPSPPVASLFLGFRREQVTHPLDGFGVLVPALEKRAMLGVLFTSTLFPGRAPDGHVALTVMIGGALQPDLAGQPPGKLWDSVRGDLRDLLGVTGEPVFQRQAFWPHAIPQYNLGHHQHLAAIAACEQANRGLFIGGNTRNGIALPDCLRAGLKLAESAVS